MTSFAATWPLLLTLIKSVALLVVLLIFIAYVLYADRKIWAAVQLRRGPNVVGPFGIWQSFADMLKFVFKEPVIPDGANKGVFLLAPFVMGMLALSAWAVIPISDGWAIADLNVGILYIFAISSLSVYGIIMGGWASNSKYPFLSALRSAAQMISLRSRSVLSSLPYCCARARSISATSSPRRTRGLGFWAGIGCRCFRCS